MLPFSQPAMSQQEKEMHLNEVTVEAAKVINKPNGKLIIPSDAEKQAANNGYSLLSKMPLPSVEVDAVSHIISSSNNRGEVQVRINGAICNKEDMLAIDPKIIKSIDFINNPRVRYGKDIAYVINIKTRRADEGYSLGTDITNTLTAWNGDNTVYTKWNHKNSELGITYNFNYRDFKGSRCIELADYLLNDGSHYIVNRDDVSRRNRNFGNQLELKYNLADFDSYVFQTTLTTDFEHDPGSYINRLFSESRYQPLLTHQRSNDKSNAPTLDLYFFHKLGKHQSFTANMVATSILTNMYNFNSEGDAYSYSVDGKTYSLTSEAIYENRLKPFMLSMGFRHRLKYTSNEYKGDVNSLNNMHNQSLYLFGELKGCWQNLSFSSGFGVSNERYRQATDKFSYWLFRPKATLDYALSDALSLRYVFEISQHISQIAMVSDTRIRTNSLEWTVGNPNLKPNSVIENDFSINFSKPRIQSDIDLYYKVNPNCNMASYSRTEEDKFMFTQKLQKGVSMLMISHYLNYYLIPDKLSFSYEMGIYRFFNYGDDYTHYLTSYDLGGSLKAYLGKWTIEARAYSGFRFMEGETRNHQAATSTLSCSYRIANCNLSLYWQQPFQANPRINKAEVVNSLVHKQLSLYSSDKGNRISLNFSWKFNQGKQYRKINRKLHNKDNQTGILK